MKNKSWEKVEQIFHTALDLSVEDRNSYLQRECAGDAALFSEVESLLSSFEQNSGFLDEPVFELGLEAINGKPQKNLSGSVIGFYELQKKIGAGGMGEVYKAVDTRLNRRVALKFLSESLENDNAARRRLVKEAQAVAMLEHPNICAVHGIEQSDEHHFIVMQYIDGETLGEYIARQTVSVEEFKTLTRQLVTAVAFAHSHGVIHRDLKPGNIMLAPDGQIKVLDFGLAKVLPHKQPFGGDAADELSRFSQNGLIIGTVSYMSPEQLRGEKLDYQSDIFSVGIILYELLTGQNPFKRESQAETIAAILGDEPPALKELSPEIPENLINLVEKCLRKDKEKRFQSAAEILVELDKTDSANTRQTIAKRRRRFFLKVAVAAVILFAVLAVVFFYSADRPQRTLAVLPITFDNPQVEKEYLADGLTQSIIDKLSNLSGLKVKNESIVARYKGKPVEPQTVGKELNADAVYLGSIIKRDESLVLATRLVRTSDGFVIDTDEQKIDEANLIELQENISARILREINANLTDDDVNKFARNDTESQEAKNFYMQGRFHLKQRKDGNAVEKAIEAFTRAQEIDQKYSKAWAGLAEAYLMQSAPGVKGAIKPKRAAELAKKMVNKAFELDKTSCDTYNSFGLISFRYDWNWREAENYFQTAINCDSEFLPARFGLINVFKMQERYEEAMTEAEKIKEFDPLSVSADIQIALIYYRKKQYDQMDRVLSGLSETARDEKRVKYVRAYHFLITGRFKEAAELLEPIYNSDNEEDKVLAAAPLGFAYARMASREKALKIIEDLEKFNKNSYVPAQEKALIYFALKNYDKVFENLTLSCAERFVSLPGWVNDPIVNDIKNDTRFAAIKECVNL